MRHTQAVVLAASLAASVGVPAHAAFITVSSASVFEAISTNFGLGVSAQQFNQYNGFNEQVSGGTGGTAWTAHALGGLMVQEGQLATAQSDRALTFSFAGNDVHAVGGNFFLLNQSFQLVVGLIQVELADGTAYITSVDDRSSFSGFISTGAAIHQITVSPFGAQPYAHAAISQLSIGAVPAPGVLATLLLGGCVGRRRR